MKLNNVFDNEQELDSIKTIAKGDILIINFGEGYGHEVSGVRPALVVESTYKNPNSATVIVAPITANPKKVALDIPNHIHLSLKKDSVASIELIRAIDKARIIKRVGRLKIEYLYQIDQALASL